VAVLAHPPRRLLALFAAALVAPLVLAGGATSFPGANGPVVFVRGGTLFTVQPGGAETNLGVAGANPSWSPDGGKIAFDDGTSVKTINADATGSTTRATGTDPTWSPDGTKLAYVSAGDLFVTGVVPALVTGGVSQPAWSPDGSKIAYVQGNDVKVVAVSGGATTNLTNSGAVDTSPTWSPDGSKIAFTSNRDGNVELYSMNADGSAQMRITSTAVNEAGPSWSPDGTKIAFTKPDSGGNDDVWSLTVADGTLSQLTNDAADDLQPDWASAFSISTPVVDAPNGTADGADLTVLPVTYSGSAPPTSFAYTWKRCSSSGGSCTTIANADAATYTLTSLDVGSTIRATVTATSSAGTATATSAPTAVVTAAAPANTVAPTITGASTASVGVALSADNGTWKGTTPMSFAYRWLRCDAAGGGCAAIAGATGSSYAPLDVDVGSALRVEVTANNGVGGPVTVQSNATEKVASSVPANVDRPTISGTVDVGSLLFADEGVWTGAPTITFTYQWQRCVDGGACSAVAGATAPSYSVTNSDAGFRLRLEVVGRNGFGNATATSIQTDLIKGVAPTNTFTPTISGFAEVGESLFASPGVWLGSPTSYDYEWRRCTSATACTAISGATTATYQVKEADLGFTLLVVVTARNTLGSAQASSSRTATVRESTGGNSDAPSVTRAPTVTGTAARGRKLTAQRGTWSGDTPITYTYQWQRCGATTAVCVAIARATGSTYTLGTADVGKRVRVVVTARNREGSTSSISSPSAVVKNATTPAGKRINGSAAANRLNGSAGPDVVHGLAGNDQLDGEAGNDKLYGDGGNDSLVGSAGRDSMFGGTGNDSLSAADGARDLVDCGSGRDTAVVDRFDVARGCERVIRRR
jgi:hypothetical protein